MSSFSRALANKLKDDYQEEGLTSGELSDIFAEEPPPLDTFLYDSQFLGFGRQNIELSPIQYSFIRYFEQILDMSTYIAMVEHFGVGWEPVRMVHTIAAMWGKGAGKDLVARVAVARVANLLLSLKSPQQYYRMPETDEIQVLNVAVNALQARRAFFKPLKNLLVGSPWFQDKFKGDIPTDAANSVTFIKNLELISGHSNTEGLEGLNLIAAIADEVGAFRTEGEVQATAGRVSATTADYIIDMLRSSASTRFPNHFKLGLISYPRYEDDAIMQAMDEGRRDNEKYGDKSTHFVSGPYSTWEVNPRVDKNSPEIVRAYNEDPEFAAAKYECKPPKASDRFLRSDTAITMGFAREEDPPIEIEYYWGLPPMNANKHIGTPQEGWQVRFYFNPSLKPMAGAIYCLHGDIAIRNDKAGIAMAHVSQYREAPYLEGRTEIDPQAFVKVDFVDYFEADLAAEHNGEKQPREVKIGWYRQLIFELLARGFHVARATFDGFQSVDLIQQLEEWGIVSEIFSLDRTTKGYDTFKATLYDGRIDGPNHPLLIEELQKLSKVGKKIDHTPKGSKDLADAVAGAVYGALQEGGSEGDSPQAVDLTFHNTKEDYYSPVDLTVGSLLDVDLGWVDTSISASW